MASPSKQDKLAESARPERRASKRLADDLLRFEAAFEKLERNRMGLGAIGPNETKDEAQAIPERDVQAYLSCLDEAIRQLAEEFSADSTVSNLIKQRDVTQRDVEILAAGARDFSTSWTVTGPNAEPIATAINGPDAASKTSSLRRPNYQALDVRPCDAAPMATMISQVDTSAV